MRVLRRPVEIARRKTTFAFTPQELLVAAITWKSFVARLHQLCEQKKSAPDLEAVLGDYVRCWARWVNGELGADKKNSASAGRFLVAMDQSSLTLFVLDLRVDL